MPTSRPFAYNSGSQVSGTDQLGQIAIGLTSSFNSGLGGLEWYNGPDEDLGYVICKTSSQRTWGNNAGNTSNTTIGFWRSPSKTENSFTSMVNSIFSQTFSTGDLAKTYLNNAGYWTSFSASLDTDAQAFITAANITDSNQQSAINTLVVNLKSALLWTKMKVIYPFVGGSAFSHKFNLKDPRDDNSAFRLLFNNNWTHNSLGAKPDGISAYANTFLTTPNSQFLVSSVHSSFYNVTNSSGGGAFPTGKTEIGSGSTNTVMSLNVGSDTNLSMGGACGGFVSAGVTLGSGGDPRGFVHINRVSTLLIKTIKNGVILATNSTPVSNLPFTGDLNIGCNYFSDGSTQRNQFSDRQAAFISFGSGLTDAESSTFYTIVQNYQTTLGRQV